MTIAQWVLDRIEVVTGAPVGSRTVRARNCPTCRARVLTGLDADLMAFDVHVDPTPTTAAGELECLINGRPTYELWPRPTPGTFELVIRDDSRIRGRPPGTCDVFPLHQCHHPLPAAPTTQANRHNRPPTSTTPPF